MSERTKRGINDCWLNPRGRTSITINAQLNIRTASLK
ncbi:Laminin subunit beta-1, partial [Araneus ventricosus]